MSVWVGGGCEGGGRVLPVATVLSANTSMESGIEAGVLPTITGSLASARDSLGSLSRAAEPTYDTDHTDLGSELDEAEIRRELMHDFDPEGFGEIPWPDFLQTLQHPDFIAQVPVHKREILLDKAKSATSDAITFQEFVNIFKTIAQSNLLINVSKMPPKIMETTENGKSLLTTVPAQWEQRATLYWPRKNEAILIKAEDSTPEINWKSMPCILKRNNIHNYESSEQQIGYVRHGYGSYDGRVYGRSR